MKPQIQMTLTETVQICNSCDMKISKGKLAMQVQGKEIYFCDESCLLRLNLLLAG